MSVSNTFFDPFELMHLFDGTMTADDEWSKYLDESLPYETRVAHLRVAAKLLHQEAQLHVGVFHHGGNVRRKLKYLLRAYENKNKRYEVMGEVCCALGRHFSFIAELPDFMTHPDIVARLKDQSLKYFEEASKKYHNDYASERLAKLIKKKEELDPGEPAKSFDRLKYDANHTRVHLTGGMRWNSLHQLSKFTFIWPRITTFQTSENVNAEQLHSLTNRKSIVRIAGLPGTGKTTLAKWIAWSWSAGQGPFAKELCVCYIPFRHEKTSLYCMIKKYFYDAHAMTESYSDAFLQAYGRQILFVFDGCTSELAQELDPVIHRAIFFCHDYSIGSDLEVCGFASFDDQLLYIKQNSQVGDSVAKSISMLLSKSEDLRRLCMAPLALDIICYIYDRQANVKLTKSEVYLQFVAEFVTARFDHKINATEMTRDVLRTLYTTDWSPGIENVLSTLDGNAFIESGLIVTDRDNSLRWYDIRIGQMVAAFYFVLQNGSVSPIYSKEIRFWQFCIGFCHRDPSLKDRVYNAMPADLLRQLEEH